MKRRLFLRSLWLKGVVLPSAYFLSPSLRATERPPHPVTGLSPEEAPAPRGCGRTETGESKPRFPTVVRDFYDPYLELIRLLKEATEIEHSLMIQYLFAAYTLKPQYQTIVGPPVPSSDGLLGIAIEEMQHLATANKLLVALGSSPNLDRQDFPHEPDIYPFELNLERMTRNSLARYTYVESGRDSIPMTGPMPAFDQAICDELRDELGMDTGLNHVAKLYGIIIDQIEGMRADGTLQLDNVDDWLVQLKATMIEGEQQHFRFFSNLLLGNHPAFEGKGNPWLLPEDHADHPSFNVATNPTAYFGHEGQILSAEARALAWLSNLHYWMVLMLLDLHYRKDSPALNAMAQAHMVGPLQSLAAALAEYGTGLPFDRLSIGYAPAPDRAGNMAFIRRLSAEADTLARKMGDGLPPGYPLGLHEATLAVLD